MYTFVCYYPIPRKTSNVELPDSRAQIDEPCALWPSILRGPGKSSWCIQSPGESPSYTAIKALVLLMLVE